MGEDSVFSFLTSFVTGQLLRPLLARSALHPSFPHFFLSRSVFLCDLSSLFLCPRAGQHGVGEAGGGGEEGGDGCDATVQGSPVREAEAEERKDSPTPLPEVGPTTPSSTQGT